MSWKGAFLAAALLLAIVAAYTALSSGPGVPPRQPPPEPFSFTMSIDDFGLADSGNASQVRAFVISTIHASGVKEATAQMLLLPNPPRRGVYEVTDYSGSVERQRAADSIRTGIASYDLGVEGGPLEDALRLKDSVIVLPSDAMPDALAGGGIAGLLDGNAVIFFGKPLDISMDLSGSQNAIGSSLYEALNVTADARGAITPKLGGPKVLAAGNATVLEYANGWLVLYSDEGAAAREGAGLILSEGWQSGAKSSTHNLTARETATAGFFSLPSPQGKYHIRLLVSAFSSNGSYVRKMDMGPAERPNGTLRIPEIIGTGKEVPYSFELHDSQEYPVRYELSLQFVRGGKVADTEPAKAVTMKTFAAESGKASPNVTAGEYVVRLTDQHGNTHALAYARVPTVKVSLVRIEGHDHVFRVFVDGKPLQRSRFTLIADNATRFQLETDQNGEARAAFILAAGVHSFTVDVGGEMATAFYRKPGNDGDLLLYLVPFAGLAFLAVTVMQGRKEKKWTIRTHPQPAERSRTLRMPYAVFLELFGMTQKDRADGLPLSVSDLRLGIRRHAAYRGAPVFTTDSNLFHLLDAMVKKGVMLSSEGYFLPAEMAAGRPVEYWVVKRRLTDHFISHGDEFESGRDADFLVHGKMVHLWGGEPDPKRLVSLSRSHDNIIVFPDAARRDGFIAKASAYDPSWMKVLLEIQYGRIYCQTMEEFLERGLHAKG